MHIVITSFGVRGDLQPYLALAVGLQRAGHRVTLATSTDFTEWIESFGVTTHPTPHSMFALMRRPETRAVLTGRNPLRQMRLFRETMRQLAASSEGLWAAIQDADLVIQSPTGTGALEAASQRSIPAVLAWPVPFAPTRAFPSFLLGPLRASQGMAYNRLTDALAHHLLWSSLGGPMTNPLRQKLGLRPWRSYAEMLAHGRRLGMPTLYGFSERVLPRPADWDELQHVTGYWFLEPPPGWSPQADPVLLRFLDRGPLPIYIGFGSMSLGTPEQQTQLALRALAMTGQRGVLLTGWGGLARQPATPDVCFVDDVLHAWLFPRMAAVVHHRGAGTTGAGLRAGVPNLIMSFGADQFAWAAQVVKLGVGPRVVPLKQVSADKLAQAINTAVHDQAMRGRAAALGEKIGAEDGVGAAVALIERHAAAFGRRAYAPPNSVTG
jgi:sterol 3beta-glucosyltransferase